MKAAAVAAIVGVLALGAGYAIGRRHGDAVSLPSAGAPLEGRPPVDVELPGPNERMEHEGPPLDSGDFVLVYCLHSLESRPNAGPPSP